MPSGDSSRAGADGSAGPKAAAKGSAGPKATPKANAVPKAAPKGSAGPKAAPKGKAGPKAAPNAKAKAKATPSERPPPKGGGRGKAKARPKRLFKNPLRQWCVRISNPTPLDLQHIWFFNTPGGPVPLTTCSLTYIVIGWEGVAPPQPRTPHLQIYLEVEPPVMWTQLKAWFHNAHIEPRFGPAHKAAEYCKKEGQFREWGDGSWLNKQESGKAVEWWQDFRRHIECCDTWKEVLTMDKYASQISGKMNWVKNVWQNRPKAGFRP